MCNVLSLGSHFDQEGVYSFQFLTKNNLLMFALLLTYTIIMVNIKEGITKCSNKLNNKLNSTCQHNKYLLEYIGMFRPVNRSSSGLHWNTSHVLFRYRGPNIFTIVNIHKI